MNSLFSEKYDRDKEYWNEYYKEKISEELIPSNFAVTVAESLKSVSNILELGCGNGRDTFFFLEHGHKVVAVDASNFVISFLDNLSRENDNVKFLCNDFVECNELYRQKYDCIYSRFTLHAITEEQENKLLKNVKGALREEGILCVEARTIHDDIYGYGIEVGPNEYIYNEHFRRFLDPQLFAQKLEKLGFSVVSMVEDKGFSKTSDSDPMLMRCIATVKK